MIKEEVAALIEVIENNTKEFESSPEKAQAFFQRAGILTKKGNLTQHYRSVLRKKKSTESKQQRGS